MMISKDKENFCHFNQILKYLTEGKMDLAIELFNKTEEDQTSLAELKEFVFNFGKFVKQYIDGAFFLNAIANGNLDVNAPEDPLRQNFVIAQYKQLHSNLRHLTWQTQQIAKGDLKQKVSYMGEFSVAFNTMIESLREKDRMEEQIKLQNVQLQKLNATKDKFFSIIAHDLKSPFNAIVGFSELLVEQVRNKDYQGVEQYAGIILQSSHRAMDLLMNLMEWSRSQTGRMEYSPVHFDLISLIHEVTLLLKDSASQKEIILTKVLPPQSFIHADFAMINTILRNLISNAIKFTKPGGEIVITVMEHPEILTVSVKDNGIGISDTRIDKLFNIAESYSTPGTHNELGTGLGLILCKEFIEKHGGRIWVESVEGKGSVFFFTIQI